MHMKFLKIPFLLIWRLWFYILIIGSIILISPLLFILTAKEAYYPTFWKMIRVWAKVLVYGMGFRLKVQNDQILDRNKSYMFCPNHASLVDPFVLIVLSKNPIVFVGKQELVKIPVFGFFYKRTCILVDRNNPRSRKEVFDRARQRMQDGVGICIFPEGGVSDDLNVVLDPFKDGAFRLAIEHQIPLLPVTLYDNKKRFPFHFWGGSPGIMRAETHAPIETVGMKVMEDKARFRESVRNIILHSLEKA